MVLSYEIVYVTHMKETSPSDKQLVTRGDNPLPRTRSALNILSFRVHLCKYTFLLSTTSERFRTILGKKILEAQRRNS